MAVVLGVTMGPVGPIFVLVVLWPLALSIGAVLGAALWWRGIVKLHVGSRRTQRQRTRLNVNGVHEIDLERQSDI